MSKYTAKKTRRGGRSRKNTRRGGAHPKKAAPTKPSAPKPKPKLPPRSRKNWDAR